MDRRACTSSGRLGAREDGNPLLRAPSGNSPGAAAPDPRLRHTQGHGLRGLPGRLLRARPAGAPRRDRIGRRGDRRDPRSLQRSRHRRAGARPLRRLAASTSTSRRTSWSASAGDPYAKLPYGDDAFDDVLCSGGVGSMTHPAETLRRGRASAAPRRALRLPRSRRRLHAPGVIRGWASTDDAGRVRIVRAYFALAPAFGPAESDLRTSLTGTGDRLWAVWAAKRG